MKQLFALLDGKRLPTNGALQLYMQAPFRANKWKPSHDEYFTLLGKFNIKLHPSKFVLFAKKLEWCGKQVAATGLKPSPSRTATVDTMADPETLADMMSFVYGVAWFRNHLIHFAKIAAPLYDMWKDALAPYKR